MAELAQTEHASEFFILGVTNKGKQFRPSDWAERLCGVMSCFSPEGGKGRNAHLKFSPYVRPTLVDGVKAVVVNTKLKQLELMAFLFVVDFAKDNDLQVVDACFLPYPDDEQP